MKQAIYLIIMLAVSVSTGCTSSGSKKNVVSCLLADTIHTQQVAMSIYDYQPVQALQIIDSAVIVGNMGEVQAEQCKARIYSFTLMHDQIDSILGGTKDVRLDSAQAIGERLLNNDSIKADLKRLRDVMEILAYTERMQNDTLGWIERSRQLVGVCHEIGSEAETDALRTEAETGAALCAMGQQEEGMAKLDSVIMILSAKDKFEELDALIIALKRKIVVLGSHDRYAETLPLARSIIERLDDYEVHPDQYHDGSHREPRTDEKRADYIRFYRNQAQSYITAAYTSLSEHGDMLSAFQQIDSGVREATAREHIAHYDALRQQMEAERQQAKASRANLIAIGIGILAMLFLAIAVIVFLKNRTIRRKNTVLAQQITDALNYKDMYLTEKQAHEPDQTRTQPADPNTLSEEQLFQHIHDVIMHERLFLDPMFGRQTIIDRFQLSKERVGAVFSKGSNHAKLSNYIQQLRLEYAAKLLIEQPDKSIVQIASDSGFSSNTYFSARFRKHFSMSPTEFRQNALTPAETS